MGTILNCIQTRLTSMLTIMLILFAFSAQAQNEDFKPYAFLGLQGGGQTTFTNYNNWKLITPTTSISVGVHFTPVIAARLHVNGFWNKGGVRDYLNGTDALYRFKYATSDLDAMINVLQLFTKSRYNPISVYLIGGVGFNYAWDIENVPALKGYISTINSRDHQCHNFRIGTMIDVDIANHWSVNLEISGNNLSDHYNAIFNNRDDWQLTAQLGVAYKFHVRQKVRSSRHDSDSSVGSPDTDAIDSETLSANTNVGLSKTEPESEPESEPVQPSVMMPQAISRSIFFTIRSTEIASKEQGKLEEVSTWLKDHPTAQVIVTGYADKGTGTATINARYAKQRAESVTKELIKKYGIEASRIKTESKGDTVQPFPNDNDLNRVTIITSKE